MGTPAVSMGADLDLDGRVALQGFDDLFQFDFGISTDLAFPKIEINRIQDAAQVASQFDGDGPLRQQEIDLYGRGDDGIAFDRFFLNLIV